MNIPTQCCTIKTFSALIGKAAFQAEPTTSVRARVLLPTNPSPSISHQNRDARAASSVFNCLLVLRVYALHVAQNAVSICRRDWHLATRLELTVPESGDRRHASQRYEPYRSKPKRSDPQYLKCEREHFWQAVLALSGWPDLRTTPVRAQTIGRRNDSQCSLCRHAEQQCLRLRCR